MSLVFVSVIISFVSFSITTTYADYRYHICSNQTTFAPNSTYQTNLNSLLSSLTSNANAVGGFYNTSVGQSPNAVYSSLLCRGDLIGDECQVCVDTAITDLTQRRCSDRKVAVIWYDHCTLRYDDETFFRVMSEAPRAALLNVGNINDTQRFNQLMAATMNESITSAVADTRMFATRESVFSELQTLYTLVQCTPDLSSLDCNRCLRGAAALLPECCSGAQGANVLYPSCNVRYEVYPFYRITKASVPNPTPELSPPPTTRGNSKLSSAVIASISVSVAVIIILLISLGWYCGKRKQRELRDDYNIVLDDQSAGNEIKTVEAFQYDLTTIQTATKNFSDDKKIGEGGFGAVYKGRLSNGQEIAVKRLSKTSLQGVGEFKNEVLLVAKLQHRNLTRLFGFCLEGKEKLLIYEFVPNKSLDYFLFDHLEDQAPLDWERRYKIVVGIARGILYLHEDSRLRIIHRDLKASNILLDEQMNPKISDFGLAKICGVDQTQGNTNRIVGTYGYMSPEYAFYGQFSLKSDVFSFGVIVIEIVTGKKGTRFLSPDSITEDLLSFTWKHWSNGTALELLDQRLGDKFTASEVLRCIHIGLLCVQEDPADRPTMATVVLMLSSYSVSLPLPKQPAFFPHNRMLESRPQMKQEWDIFSSKSSTINEMSITDMYPR